MDMFNSVYISLKAYTFEPNISLIRPISQIVTFNEKELDCNFPLGIGIIAASNGSSC